MEREKPEDADLWDWDAFQAHADRNGYGEYTDDWSPWWECWKAGYSAAMQL